MVWKWTPIVLPLSLGNDKQRFLHLINLTGMCRSYFLKISTQKSVNLWTAEEMKLLLQTLGIL